MKILFLNSPEVDYLQDLTYAGLVKILKKDGVIDFPYNKHFHKSRRKYPQNLGTVKEYKGKKYSKRSILKLLKEGYFNIVMIASTKPQPVETFLSLFNSKCPLPVVFVDGGDYEDVGGDFYRLKCPELYKQAINVRRFDLIFKRELKLNKHYGENVFPLPFSINEEKIPTDIESNHTNNVFFWAVKSSPVRIKAMEILQDFFDYSENSCKLHQTFKNYKYKGHKYLQQLSQAKICLSFRGVGFDTLRYWEIPAVKSLLLSENPLIRIDNNFRNGKDAVFCHNDLSDLKDLITYYLKNDREREEIAMNGYKQLMKFHTCQKRAEYIIDTIQSKLNI